MYHPDGIELEKCSDDGLRFRCGGTLSTTDDKPGNVGEDLESARVEGGTGELIYASSDAMGRSLACGES